MKVIQYYIGYINLLGYNDPILLCTSTRVEEVQYYLEVIRQIDRDMYEIRTTRCNIDVLESLYTEYQLQEYNNDYIYLTDKDIGYLNREIDTQLREYEKMYQTLIGYRGIISDIDKFNHSKYLIDGTIEVLRDQLGISKNNRKIANEIVDNSIILSPNIHEYLEYIGILQEDRELTELFYQKINSD